jgi:hypothetical protein
MAIMGRNQVSGKVVKDDYGKESEPTFDGIKADKKDPPYTGIADSFNYGGKSGSK